MMNNDNANRYELPPQGNPNFPTNPPPVVANPHYQHGAPPVQQLPPPQQEHHYHGPQFVPMIAPQMQQQWPLGHKQPMQQAMNPEDVNRNVLPPQGNPNFPTNPPPVVANTPYQYGVPPMPQLSQLHQLPYYNPPQFVPVVAPPVQQLWSVGQQQQMVQQVMHMQQQMHVMQQQMQQLQQQVQQTPPTHQMPYGQQPTNFGGQPYQSQQIQGGHLAPQNALQSQINNNMQQQVHEPVMPVLQPHAPLMASETQQQVVERQQNPQWNVDAPEFLPQPVLDEALSTSSSGTGSEEEEASTPEQSSQIEMKTMTPPPAELEELAVEASPERLQDVISLGAPASETSVSSGEKAGITLGRSPSYETTAEGVLVEHIDNRLSGLALEDVDVDVEEATVETSNKDAPSTSAIFPEETTFFQQEEIETTASSSEPSLHPQELSQTVPVVKEMSVEEGECSTTHKDPIESRKQEVQSKKKQKEAAEKLAKKIQQEKESTDAAALEEAFAANMGLNAEKQSYRDQLKKYAKTESVRRQKFLKNGGKLPNDTVLHWMTADIYLFRRKFGVRSKSQNQRFNELLLSQWNEAARNDENAAPMVPYYEVLRESRDEVVQYDISYLSEMMYYFPDYDTFLEEELTDVLFDEKHEVYPKVAVCEVDRNSNLVAYLTKHSILRYTNRQHHEKLSDLEIETIAAFKRNRWSGISIREAIDFFLHRGAFYWAHADREKKPFIKRNAMIFKFLASIPSPILAFDASSCFDPVPNVASDTRYAIMVMGNDEVPPYKE